MMSVKRKVLNGWMIALINLAAVTNIKNFPLLAEYGLSIIVFIFLSSLFFFLPAAFVSAELASAWPDRGIYTWVKEALGPRMGFLAIWLQWVENVIWYPTILAFIAGTLAYVIDPSLASNKIYILSVILSAFWGATWINFLGMEASGWISAVTVLLGTIVPIVLIILLSGFWVLHHPSAHISWSWKGLLPDFSSINQLVLFSGVLLGLSGIEMSAVHARDVLNPRKDYPLGIFLAAALIILVSVLGGLSIAAVVPRSQIELASGSMEAFRLLFDAFQIPWATPVIASVTFVGALGMMSTWIVGPSRGLHATAEDGHLPSFFYKTNKNGMPTHILIIQAMTVTLLSLIFLFMPSVNSSYWILVALASILYQIMYILMFISAIRLRKSHPMETRFYKIPFGNRGIWTVGTLGIIGSSFGLIFAFFPPTEFTIGTILFYESCLIGGALLFSGFPFIIYTNRKK